MILTDVIGGSMFDFTPRFLHKNYAIHVVCKEKLILGCGYPTTGISSSSIAKLKKGKNITTGILSRICEALDCDITDSIESVIE